MVIYCKGYYPKKKTYFFFQKLKDYFKGEIPKKTKGSCGEFGGPIFGGGGVFWLFMGLSKKKKRGGVWGGLGGLFSDLVGPKPLQKNFFF